MICYYNLHLFVTNFIKDVLGPVGYNKKKPLPHQSLECRKRTTNIAKWSGNNSNTGIQLLLHELESRA